MRSITQKINIVSLCLLIFVAVLAITPQATAFHISNFACYIGNYVWLDSDGNGIQDVGESGINGVTVNVYDCDGNFVGTDITRTYGSSDGYYWVYIKKKGFYVVEFILPMGYAFAQQDMSGNDEKDSDVDPATGKTSCKEYYIDLTVDAGLVECFDCDGGVTELTLHYTGTNQPVNIVVYEGKKPKEDKELFNGTVLSNDEFTFSGTRPDGTMGKEISIYVGGVLNTKIHTSCSQPIGPGLVRGKFEVVEGFSRDGGKLCPLPECLECKGGVTQLTLLYDNFIGGENIAVYEGKKPKPDKKLFEQYVLKNHEFTFSGIRKDGTMGKEISIYVGGVLNTKIHTSCSQPIGPGLVRGAFEVVEGYSRKGNKLCPVDFPPSGLCAKGIKPRMLTMVYTGESCSASNHSQDAGKVSCNGDPGFAESVLIIASDKDNPNDPKAKVWFKGTVNIDGQFDIDATYAGESKLKANTYVHIFDPSGSVLLQTIQFHTSCSQPLNIGDQFGSLLLVDFLAE